MRPSRAASKRQMWMEISDFFFNSPLPEDANSSYLTDAMDQCHEWKRYVEQDISEALDLDFQKEHLLEAEKKSTTGTQNGEEDTLNADSVAEGVAESQHEHDEEIEKLDKFLDGSTKFWVLSGLKEKPTKSTKKQEFQITLPEGEGLRLLNVGRDFKLPWDVYCPTISDERKTVPWKNSLKRNEWRVQKVFDPVKKTKCDCPFGNCDKYCTNRVLQTECTPHNCSAGEVECGNRQFTDLIFDLNARSRYAAGYEVVDCGIKGAGLVAIRSYSAGSLIVEYTGEVIDLFEVEHRLETIYKDTKNFYFLGLEDDLIIDSGQRGSVARFANHSCDPNAEIQKWYVNNEPRIGLFARRYINPGEEITYDYNFESFDGADPQKCSCGSDKCRGIIAKKPESEVKGEASKQNIKADEDDASYLSDLSVHDDAYDEPSVEIDDKKLAQYLLDSINTADVTEKRLPENPVPAGKTQKNGIDAPRKTNNKVAPKEKVTKGQRTRNTALVTPDDDNNNNDSDAPVDDDNNKDEAEVTVPSVAERVTRRSKALTEKLASQDTSGGSAEELLSLPKKRKRLHISDSEEESDAVLSPQKPLPKRSITLELKPETNGKPVVQKKRGMQKKSDISESIALSKLSETRTKSKNLSPVKPLSPIKSHDTNDLSSESTFKNNRHSTIKISARQSATRRQQTAVESNDFKPKQRANPYSGLDTFAGLKKSKRSGFGRPSSAQQQQPVKSPEKIPEELPESKVESSSDNEGNGDQLVHVPNPELHANGYDNHFEHYGYGYPPYGYAYHYPHYQTHDPYYAQYPPGAYEQQQQDPDGAQYPPEEQYPDGQPYPEAHHPPQTGPYAAPPGPHYPPYGGYAYPPQDPYQYPYHYHYQYPANYYTGQHAQPPDDDARSKGEAPEQPGDLTASAGAGESAEDHNPHAPPQYPQIQRGPRTAYPPLPPPPPCYYPPQGPPYYYGLNAGYPPYQYPEAWAREAEPGSHEYPDQRQYNGSSMADPPSSPESVQSLEETVATVKKKVVAAKTPTDPRRRK